MQRPGFIFVAKLVLVGFFLIFAAGFANGASAAEANSTDAEVQKLQAEIEQKTKEIKALEAEAEQYRNTIATTVSQANTLKGEIARITAAITRLQRDIRVNQGKIKKTDLEIKSLGLQINQGERDIAKKRKHLAELFRTLSRLDQEGALTLILKHDRFSDLFGDLERLLDVEAEVNRTLSDLHDLQETLGEKKSASETKVKELTRFVSNLTDQKELQALQQAERNRVLKETKSQEERYRTLLAENEKRREALESEILEFENKLHITIDPSTLPTARSGILGWPVPPLVASLFQCGHSVFAFLTQCFGNTAFARSGAYNGKGHNGIDLRAEVGSEIRAAEEGTVRSTGDTDLGCRRASYGKWVLVDHPNNLSSLYAHLSLIKVFPGQVVSRGDVIGYAGKTGYALGPHLHFTVFAKAAVEVGILKSRVCGRNMTLPLSPPNGYLDPLSYL